MSLVIFGLGLAAGAVLASGFWLQRAATWRSLARQASDQTERAIDGWKHEAEFSDRLVEIVRNLTRGS